MASYAGPSLPRYGSQPAFAANTWSPFGASAQSATNTAAPTPPPNLPSTEMPGWLDILQRVTGKEKPTWADYLGSLDDGQKDWLDVNPQAGYSAYKTLTGLGTGSSRQAWMDRQYDKYRGQYETMATRDPALFWSEFMARLNPEADYKLLATPYDRGEYRSGFSLAPTMRMSW